MLDFDADHRGSLHALPLSRKRNCARVKSCKSTPSRDDLTNSGHSAADELPVEARDISLHRCDGFQNLPVIRNSILGLLAFEKALH